MKRFVSVVAVLALAACAEAPTEPMPLLEPQLSLEGGGAAQILLATTMERGSSSDLVELDIETGALVRTIGPVGYPVNGLHYDPTTETLYATTSRYATAHRNGLLSIDMETGAGTPIGTPWELAVSHLTGDSKGDLYAQDPRMGYVVQIDKGTGQWVPMAYGRDGSHWGFDFDSHDVLWLFEREGDLYTLDLTTQVWTLMASDVYSDGARNGDFDPDTDLYYGISETLDQDQALRVLDPGKGTLVFESSALPNDIHVLAFAPAPMDVTASLIPVPGKSLKHNKGHFEVVYTCEGGDITSALLNGVPVEDGLIVDLRLKSKKSEKSEKSGKSNKPVKIEGTAFELVVVCTNASTSKTASAAPTFSEKSKKSKKGKGGGAAQILLATTMERGSSSDLVELDIETGALVRTIGPVGYPVNGLHYDPTTETLYATTSRYATAHRNGLLSIDMETGAGTPIGTPWELAVSHLTGDSKGDLYAQDPRMGYVVQIDKGTGQWVPMAYGRDGSHWGFDFDSHDVLWLFEREGDLYTLDLTTQVWTLMASDVYSDGARNGDFDPDTDLYYGISETLDQDQALRVLDPGKGTLVFESSALPNDIHVLAFAPAQ